MLLLFQPVCFSSSGSDHFNIRKINSKFSQRCLFHPSPSCLCFPAVPPFFLQGLRFLDQVSILLMWSLSILFLQCSYPVILMKILTEPQVRHSSFFSSPVDSIQAFGVDHIPFPRSKYFSILVHLIIIPHLLFYYSGVFKISRRFVFPLYILLSSFEDVISF